MQKRAFLIGGSRVVLIDSITQLAPEDAGSIVVAASHGGVSSAEIALSLPLRAVLFNDAGVGKDDAGIASLELLQRASVAAAVVAHTSARIGDVEDMWAHGVVSHANAAAGGRGIVSGITLREAVAAMARATATRHPA